MEINLERMENERDCMYLRNVRECFIMKEADNPDYRSAVVLLRNLVEKRDTTSLERDALSTAVRLLRQNMEEKNGYQSK